MPTLSPYNAFTRHQYTRGNIAILTAAVETAGFAIPAWLTAMEVEKLGGKIRDGELGRQIYFAGRFHPQRRADDEEEEGHQSKFHKDFTVYNLEQCEFSDGVYSHLRDVKRCFTHFADLTEREREFVKSLSRRPYPLSDKQRSWLNVILARLPE